MALVAAELMGATRGVGLSLIHILCGHGKGLYPWGRDGKPAYNGIISTDSRAWKYPEKWHENGVYDEVHDRLCQEFMACQQVSLLAWLKDHERAVYDNIQYAFSVKDYVRFRLTGEAYSEATDISGSGLMNVRDARFDKDILEKLGIGEAYDMLPPLRYSYDLCGTVSEEAAKDVYKRQDCNERNTIKGG